ncbi:MAG TPA: zinc-dependent metalloprotease [Caulobacteraceae bacterium]|jgi:hypothetical protein|nr:zinc-dependent metalloprotease [Caulobacteraceae bacterium]
MRVGLVLISVCLAAFAAPSLALAKAHAGRDPAPAPSPSAYAKATAGLTRMDGLLPVFVDKAQGKIFLSLAAPDADGVLGRFIYLSGLKTGLGSAPLGLDRSQPGDDEIIVFRRIGKKVTAEFENQKFRAVGAPAAEQASAQNSFAYSTVWAGDVAGEGPDGRVLVDITSFITRDSVDIAGALTNAGEKGWKQSADLSIADPSAVKVFPENLEFEARETFQNDSPGAEVANIAPNAKSISFVVRQSLVKLPEPGFVPRRFDPRTGAFATEIVDYGAKLGDPVVTEVAQRFRLEKINPGPAPSRVKKPIVFYVDRAAPEPIRSALVEGASWWAKAFTDAGYIDAYRVEVAPEGMDPLDVRYNFINWVDRATRGWSYGQGVVDPRTGEIIKGSVLLGSLRVRQDVMIFEALAGADKDNSGAQDDPVRVALMRIRQLGAHETGHGLGFGHNFAGSTQDRTSVMDYPPPRIRIDGGKLDFSDAYAVGIGKWDEFSVDWLYGYEPDDNASRAKAQAEQDSGMRFITDADARPEGAAQPWASLWDDGPDPAAELTRMMSVRRIALDNFGLRALHPGEPVQDLRRKYVPVYLLHRYQVDAASKMLAGVAYVYSLNGDAHEAAPLVPASDQRRALDAMLATLSPAELDTPERLLPLLSAGYSGSDDRQFDIEVFATQGGPVFDPLVAADVAASMTLNAILAPDRLDRLADQHRRDPNEPGVEEVLDKLIGQVWAAPGANEGRLGEVRRRIETRTLVSLAEAERASGTSREVASIIDQKVSSLMQRLKDDKSADPAERAHRQYLARLLTDRHELERVLAQPTHTATIPPGMPIGEGEWMSDLVGPTGGR